MKYSQGFGLTSALLLFSLMNAPIAAGKEGAEPARALEEVLVTARKRTENIQETPVAVTAFSGDSLRERGILAVDELSKSVPSLQISNSTTPQIYIRGIGQRAAFARFDPSVSVYLDGLFIPRPEGQLLDTIDVQSIQVLRGPQGTLFGKNNTGGAIVFTLTKPGEDAGSYIEGALGNFNERRIQAALDLPVTDDFYTRFTVNARKRDGYLKDATGRENQSINRLSGIFQARWLPTDSLTIDGFAFVGRVREDFPSYNCKIANEDALFVNGLGILWPGDTDPSNPSAYKDNCHANSRAVQKDLHTNQGESQRQQKDQDELMVGLTFDYQINDNHDLKAILGLRDATKMNPQTTTDEGGPKDLFRADLLDDSEQESYTAELQLSGLLFDRVDYAAGIFYQDEYKSERFITATKMIGSEGLNFLNLAAGQQGLDLGALGAQVNAIAASVPGGSVPILAGVLPMATVQDFEIEGQTAAVYAQATWHLTENFELTFGGRYTSEHRESYLVTRGADLPQISQILTTTDPRFIPLVPDMAAMAFAGPWALDPLTIANNIITERFPGSIQAPLLAPTFDTRGDTFKQFTPMVSAAYIFPEEMFDDSWLDSAMVYATWSNGFKSGFQEPFGLDGLSAVKPEELENREVGFKIDALQRSLRINLAAYSMIFTNMHLITVNIDSKNTLVVGSQNAAESSINGTELEIMWFPSAKTLINFTYSFNKYEFQEFIDKDLQALALRGEIVPVDRSDETFPVSPEHAASLGIQYTIDTDFGLLIPRLDATYKSEVYMGLDNASWDAAKRDKELVYADDYVLLDARLGWTNTNEDVNVAFYIKNLGDIRYDIGAVATAESVGTFITVQGEPRTYGLEVRKTF